MSEFVNKSNSLPSSLGVKIPVNKPSTDVHSFGSEKTTQPTRQEKLDVQLDFAKVSRQPSDEHLLFSPMHYEPGYAYPLLVWLHGPGSDERQIMKVLPVISMRNFVGVAPRGVKVEPDPEYTASEQLKKNRKAELIKNSVPELMLRLDQEKKGKEKHKILYNWPQTENGIAEAEQQVFDCISLAEEKCNIAKNKVFLVGFDSGGTMAFRLAMQYPQYFAGVISLGGSFPTDYFPLGQWAAARNLPAMLAIGKESRVYSPDDARSDLKLFHTAGLSISVRQYPCGQELAPQMLQDVNRWIMERVCG